MTFVEETVSQQTKDISRRRVLQTAVAATVGFGASAPFSQGATADPTQLKNSPQLTGPTPTDHVAFQHGVASGDPLPNSVLLWTRVTSHPDDYAGRGLGTPTLVRWDVATDADFHSIAASGTIAATPATDMTVKPEAHGLAPYTQYFYRFTISDGPLKGQVSPVGRTLTAPSASQDLNELRFALCSCSNWEAGFFHAYADMTQRTDIDYVVHVGDYIYEYRADEYNGKTGAVRRHLPVNEIVTLQDYRERYAQYRTDKDLQVAHAACPWIVTWDDHEIANDNWSGGAENHTPDEGDYLARRDAAAQAYLEWLPIRSTPFSEGGHIYRNISFGKLAELNMLDLRTYRNQAPTFQTAQLADDESRTMLGSEQFAWLESKLSSSTAHWNLIGNSVMISPVLIPPLDPKLTYAITQLIGAPDDGYPYSFDQWDGFVAERRRLLEVLNSKGIANTIWLTGDIHSSWACDIPNQPGTYPASGSIATEFVCPSITSSNVDDILKLPEANPLSEIAQGALQTANRHVRYLDLDKHGYCVVQVTMDFIHTDWIFMQPDNKLQPTATFFIGRSARKYRDSAVVMHDAPMPIP